MFSFCRALIPTSRLGWFRLRRCAVVHLWLRATCQVSTRLFRFPGSDNLQYQGRQRISPTRYCVSIGTTSLRRDLNATIGTLPAPWRPILVSLKRWRLREVDLGVSDIDLAVRRRFAGSKFWRTAGRFEQARLLGREGLLTRIQQGIEVTDRNAEGPFTQVLAQLRVRDAAVVLLQDEGTQARTEGQSTPAGRRPSAPGHPGLPTVRAGSGCCGGRFQVLYREGAVAQKARPLRHVAWRHRMFRMNVEAGDLPRLTRTATFATPSAAGLVIRVRCQLAPDPRFGHCGWSGPGERGARSSVQVTAHRALKNW